jgi:hypothetical protein
MIVSTMGFERCPIVKAEIKFRNNIDFNIVKII